MPDTQSASPDRGLRLKAIAKLGGRCVGNTCRWHNADGTYGCTDERALQFDHKDGGGSSARRKGKDSLRQIYYQVLNGSLRFRLLCASCHEIRKKVERQAQGANQHEQPARLRQSLQIEGEPVRRVREKPEIEAEQAERRFLAAMRRQTKLERLK